MTDILIDVDAKETLRHIELLLEVLSVSSLGQFMETEADAVIKFRIQNRFDLEGDDVTGPWLPLKPATQNFRRSHGFPPSNPINYRSGKLYHWLMNMRPDVQVLNYGEVLGTWPGSDTTDSLTTKKFETAQKGDGRRTVARPVLVINDRDLRMIEFELSLYLGKTGLTWT